MNVGMLACYDQAKEVVASALSDPMENGVPSLSTKMGSSCIAGFTAALFSLPFDLIKSRLMAQKIDAATGKMPYKGVADCAVQIFRQEGPLGFFGGFTAYYGRCAPHAMIILLSIESITAAYRSTFSWVDVGVCECVVVGCSLCPSFVGERERKSISEWGGG